MDLKILGIWRIVTQPLTPFYVVPGYTFFYWGFTVAKRHNPEYMKFFDLNSENKVVPITIKIGNRNFGKISVESGIEEGDIVISEGVSKVRNKSKVKIINTK